MSKVYPKYRGRPIIPSNTSMDELMRMNLSLADVVGILNQGFDCSRSRRKSGIIERCIRRRNKIIKVVVAKDYNHTLETDCWVLIHAGMF